MKLDDRITRRDFVNSVLIGTGAALCSAAAPLASPIIESRGLLPATDLGPDWYGYGGVGDYADSHGNTPEVVYCAHAMRDGAFDDPRQPVIDTKEAYDVVIVGGGIAGLGAASRFVQTRGKNATALLLENHPIFGGESKRNEFIVDGYRLIAPQGANGFSVPHASGGEFAQDDARFFQELGIPREYEYAQWPSDLTPLKFGQDDYGFLYWLEDSVSMGYFFDEKSHGVSARWVKDPWSTALRGFPISNRLREDLLRWRSWSKRPYNEKDFQVWLDSMTYREFVVNVLGLDAGVADYADPILASSAGGCSGVLSAYSAYSIGLPGVAAFYEDFSLGERHSFPGGNDGFARCFVKAIIPQAIDGSRSFSDIIRGRVRFDLLDNPGQPVRMRLGSTVVRVEHEGPREKSDFVRLTYVRHRRLFTVRARAVVMATGAWVTKYVVRDLPESHVAACKNFHHTAMLIANVALRSWRFLYDLGITGFRWWNDLGFACNLKRPMYVASYRPPFHPDKPAVLSFYIPFYYPGSSAEQQGILGRTELLGTRFAEYETKICRLMTRLFGRHGFDARKHVAGIILNRWGHAYVLPQAGFYFGRGGSPPPRDVIRQPHGRIAFGHSELVGNQHWGRAAAEGSRAVDQLRAVV